MTTDQQTILDPTSAEYVLPSPPRPAGDVVVVAPRVDLARAWRRGGEVARCLGERFSMLAENQQVLAAELRERLCELDLQLADATRAQLKGAVRQVLSVLDWSDAVQSDLIRESHLAATGAEPVDVAELCQEVARAQGQEQPVFVSGHANAPWWGAAASLAEVVRQALLVVAERTQGAGARRLEVGETAEAVLVHIAGTGEPGDALDAGSVVRFRRAVEQAGIAVKPDALGPGGAGLVLELPKQATAAP